MPKYSFVSKYPSECALLATVNHPDMPFSFENGACDILDSSHSRHYLKHEPAESPGTTEIHLPVDFILNGEIIKQEWADVNH